MEKIGKKEIYEALANMDMSKDIYEACEFDNFICEYYNLEYTEYEALTEASHEFNYIVDVFDYIDEIVTQRGFKTDDGLTYKRKKEYKPRAPKVHPGQLSLF